MTIESFQDTLFEDPIGLRFRHAREKAKWTQEFVAQQLKLPVAVLDAIEREDWARLGAPIFVRSYVGSYAKLLGLPASLADEVVRGKPAPQLTTIGSGLPAKRSFDRGLMNLAYLAMTIAIVGSVVMLAMYFQSPKRSAVSLPLDQPAGFSASQGVAGEGPGAAASAAEAAAVDSSAPVIASLAPTLPQATTVDGVVLRFRGESWLGVVDHTGATVAGELVLAGQERRFPAGQVAGITLGNAAAVDIASAGAPVDMSAFSEPGVVRFTVSSDGAITPVSGATNATP